MPHLVLPNLADEPLIAPAGVLLPTVAVKVPEKTALLGLVVFRLAWEADQKRSQALCRSTWWPASIHQPAVTTTCAPAYV